MTGGPHIDEPSGTRPTPSTIAQSVVRQVLDRDAHGQRKYGVSLDRTDLSTEEWLQHMAEELMDGAHYALAAKREIERREISWRVNAQLLVVSAMLSVRNPYTGGNADREMAFVQGMEAVRVAITQELSK